MAKDVKKRKRTAHTEDMRQTFIQLTPTNYERMKGTKGNKGIIVERLIERHKSEARDLPKLTEPMKRNEAGKFMGIAPHLPLFAREYLIAHKATTGESASRHINRLMLAYLYNNE